MVAIWLDYCDWDEDENNERIGLCDRERIHEPTDTEMKQQTEWGCQKLHVLSDHLKELIIKLIYERCTGD